MKQNNGIEQRGLPNNNRSRGKRSNSRIILLMIMYSKQYNHDQLAKIDQMIIFIRSVHEHLLKDYDVEYFNFLFDLTMQHQADIMLIYEECGISQYNLHFIDKLILIIAGIELKYSHDLGYKIIINEALELAKMFGSYNSYKIINTFTDQLAKTIQKNK